MMKKITIKDIAREASVSISTVSNVLNNRSSKASQETKDRIKTIIEKYNYSPDLNARSMVTKESGMIAILYYTEKNEVNFSDPFLSDILTGIELSSKLHQKFILVHGFSDIDDIKKLQQNWSFDGYVVIGALQSVHQQLDRFLTAPVVFVDTYAELTDLSTIYPRFYIYNNDFEMSYQATKYLIKHGHQKIAIFSPILGKDDAGVVHERFSGYCKALEQSNLEVSEQLFFEEAEFDRLVSDSGKYTAVLANSDFLAGKLISIWKEKKITDKAVISFDNSFFSEFLEPKLTTIDLKQKEKGKKAIEVLISSLKGSSDIVQKYFIQGELVKRDSVFFTHGDE